MQKVGRAVNRIYDPGKIQIMLCVCVFLRKKTVAWKRFFNRADDDAFGSPVNIGYDIYFPFVANFLFFVYARSDVFPGIERRLKGYLFKLA